MSQPTSISGHGDRGRVFHLPVRSHSLTFGETAIYLGITPRRLRLLYRLNTGPRVHYKGRYGASFRRDALDEYVTMLHENAGISLTEIIRRRSERAPLREATLQEARGVHDRRLQVPLDPFMMLATWREVCEHGVYLMLKVLALLGLILLCISSTPLLRAHF